MPGARGPRGRGRAARPENEKNEIPFFHFFIFHFLIFEKTFIGIFSIFHFLIFENCSFFHFLIIDKNWSVFDFSIFSFFIFENLRM